MKKTRIGITKEELENMRATAKKIDILETFFKANDISDLDILKYLNIQCMATAGINNLSESKVFDVLDNSSEVALEAITAEYRKLKGLDKLITLDKFLMGTALTLSARVAIVDEEMETIVKGLSDEQKEALIALDTMKAFLTEEQKADMFKKILNRE